MTPSEQLRDLLQPGVNHIFRGRPDLDARLIATHGRIDVVVLGPQVELRRELLTSREIDADDFRMRFKPRVEAILHEVCA